MREVSAITMLFALRCIVPLAITLTIGYAMTRLYDRLEAEAGVEIAAEAQARTASVDPPDLLVASWLQPRKPREVRGLPASGMGLLVGPDGLARNSAGCLSHVSAVRRRASQLVAAPSTSSLSGLERRRAKAFIEAATFVPRRQTTAGQECEFLPGRRLAPGNERRGLNVKEVHWRTSFAIQVENWYNYRGTLVASDARMRKSCEIEGHDWLSHWDLNMSGFCGSWEAKEHLWVCSGCWYDRCHRFGAPSPRPSSFLNL